MSKTHQTEATIPSQRSYLAIASLAFGLASIPLFTFLTFGFGAIVTGLMARRKSRELPKSRNYPTMAFGGIILGFLSLVAGFFAVPTVSIAKAKATTALATVIALERAINEIHIEYGKIPEIGNRVTTNSPEGIELLNILLGLDEKSDNALNSRGIKFLRVKEGKNQKNGIIYAADGKSVKGLFDPWGNPYTVILDTEYKEHLHFAVGSLTVDLKGRRAAVFSPGPDIKPGTDDDVRNW